MSRTALLILVLALWILLALFLCWKYFCPCCALAGKDKSAAVAAATTVPAAAAALPAASYVGAWEVNDSTTLKLSSPDHLRFLRSSFERMNPSAKAGELLTSTANYLKANKNRRLTITGYYDDNERNGSVLGNLGLARANDVKSFLASLGVPPNQLDISFGKHTENWWAGDTLMRGVSFDFSTIPAQENNRLELIKSRLVGKPLTLYFETNKDSLDLSAQQRQDFTDLVYYLDQVPASKLQISGHTDNVGDRNYNIQLSRERADFAKNFLSKNGGLQAARMHIDGFGPDKPIGSNDTPEGRAQNRRVEVVLQ